MKVDWRWHDDEKALYLYASGIENQAIAHSVSLWFDVIQGEKMP